MRGFPLPFGEFADGQELRGAAGLSEPANGTFRSQIRSVPAVLEHRFDELMRPILSAVLSLPRRDLPVVRGPVVLGFDSEWDPKTEGSPLLSVQLAVFVGDTCKVRVFDPPAPRLMPDDLLRLARQFLDEVGVEVKPDRRKIR